jgi:hypothetical protein
MNTRLCFKLRILFHDDGLQRPKHEGCTDECNKCLLCLTAIYCISSMNISIIDYPNNSWPGGASSENRLTCSIFSALDA